MATEEHLDLHPAAATHEHHHRNIQGGMPRATVFGVSDGLVSNIALILGMAGADPSPSVVRLAGLVGLLGGAFSMAAGEYVSMRAQSELLERELEMERGEILRRPDNERRELAAIYRNRGVAPDVADRLAHEMMADPDVALETHAREELGIDPTELGSPAAASIWSFGAFAVGAAVPLVPWFFGGGTAAKLLSLLLGAVASVLVGILLARFTDRSPLRSAARQAMIGALAAVVPYLIGKAVGVTAGG